MPFPSERLAEFEGAIRGFVALGRSFNLNDESIVVTLVHGANSVFLAGWNRRDDEALNADLAWRFPDLRTDFAKPVKPGHVTVLVVAPEGNGVFHVKIARAST